MFLLCFFANGANFFVTSGISSIFVSNSPRWKTMLLFKCSYSTITSSFPHVFSSFHNSVSTMHLLFTDASSIIKSIKKIHAQHVDLTPDNTHVLRYTGRKFSWVNNPPGKTKQFTSFTEKRQDLQEQRPVKKWMLSLIQKLKNLNKTEAQTSPIIA